MTSAAEQTGLTSPARYAARRAQLKTYFDRTAADAWAKLTSDAPVSGVRAKVRAGRDGMRALALNRLPADLSGVSVLDAGCGPGQFSIEAARRGADVTAVDLSQTLVGLAQGRAGEDGFAERIDFHVGDMLAPVEGEDAQSPAYDHVVALDSLIHYDADHIAEALGRLASRARRSVVATYAPRTPLLATMHFVGGLFPQRDRAPAIQPVSPKTVRRRIAALPALDDWSVVGVERIDTGFYVSEAIELRRKEVADS